MNPAELGYYERRPGNGIWYLPGNDKTTYEPKTCEYCLTPFMGERKKGKGRFCSKSCAQLKPGPTYRTRHQRVQAARGLASQSPCVDRCGRQAEDWSQKHGTDGLDVYTDYDPRCRSCHRAYDEHRGEGHGMSKLTDAQVRGIYASVEATQQELADLHGGISRRAVGDIRRGDAWKHLTGGRKADW